jgi:hypothetical protein
MLQIYAGAARIEPFVRLICPRLPRYASGGITLPDFCQQAAQSDAR